MSGSFTMANVKTLLAAASLAVPCIAGAQVGVPPLDDTLRRPLDPALERVDDRLSRIERRREALEEEARQAAEEAAPAEAAADAVDETAEQAGDAAGKAVEAANDAAAGAAQTVSRVAGAVLRPFTLAADPAGWPVEQDIVVTLLDEDRTDAATRHGLEIVARRNLPALGLVMVTLRNPPGAALRQTVTDMRTALPDAVVDFNHVYRYATDSPGTTIDAPERDEHGSRGSLRVGMIDSAVLAEHTAFHESRIVGKDFVTHEGLRPRGHGTAVASLIANSAGNGVEILSASVFFQTENYAPGATTESLVAALDWLASEDVDAINMSLAGPGNDLLEKAVEALFEGGPPVIAAVGNNGPSGEPLYPAAYADVIGVTAVDREGKVFLYANRGDHVDYAALGVNVKVADSEGTWRLESGTSMASPHVAVIVARTLANGPMTLDGLLAALTASADDLGRKGFDSTFGHGLITEAPVLASQGPAARASDD